jgi:hypothetical protein
MMKQQQEIQLAKQKHQRKTLKIGRASCRERV